MVDYFLGADQTIFSNPDALDPNFVPKLLPHREEQQKYLATAIKPLLHGRAGKQLLVTGAPGIGKTACVKRVLMDLAEIEEADNLAVAYINCWKANTSYKIAVSIANAVGFKFTHNLKTNEVIDKIFQIVAKKDGIVLVFDEIDKAEDYDFLYYVLEGLQKKALILITNEPHWGLELDPRIRSRLTPESLEFNQYSRAETEDILRERCKYAFFEGTWDNSGFQKIVDKATQYKDIRVGLTLMKVAGELAEQDSSKKVELKHAEQAILKVDEFKIKSSADLTDEEKHILAVCKENNNKPFGEIYRAYIASGGKKSEKTLKRKLEKLRNKKLIDLKLTGAGFSGRSSIVKYIGYTKKLTDF